MINVLRFALAVLWLWPMTLFFWIFYLFPALALGWLVYDGSPRFLVARLLITDKNQWYRSKWEGWGGQALPHAVLLVSYTAQPEELRHTDQWLVFGIFFLPIWWLANLLLGYDNNPLEVDAKKWAALNP